MKAAIAVGHHTKAPGAVSRHLEESEFEWNSKVASQLQAELCGPVESRVFFRPGPGYPGDEIEMCREINRWGATLAFELHFNSFYSESAQGSEVLYWHRSTAGRQLAEEFQRRIVDALGTKDRGVKPIRHKERGYAFMQYTAMPSALIEPFFGSSQADTRRAVESYNSYIQALASAAQGYQS